VLKDMPKPRCHHQLVYHKAAIYAFGGKLINDTRPPTGMTFRLDIPTNTWLPLQEMKTPRFNFASIVFYDKIYAIGGFIKDNVKTNNIEEYDIKTKSWLKSNILLPEKSSCGYAFV